MKKYLAIFAHYDKDCMIDSYVVHYLQDLNDIVKDIIFVSDVSLSDVEKKKIDWFCLKIIDGKHGEYDFGSWKKAIKEIGLKTLQQYEGLILANDSNFLLSSLKNPFYEMSKRDSCDLWGIAQSKQYGVNAVHSYFMVFDKKVFGDLVGFLEKVTKETEKEEIVRKYEIGLSDFLIKKGYKIGSYLGSMNHWDILRDSYKVICKGSPFLKVSAIIDHHCEYNKLQKYNLISDSNKNYLIRRIGKDAILEKYSLSNYMFNFSKVFLHKKFFWLRIKNRVLRIKLFGIPVFMMKI